MDRIEHVNRIDLSSNRLTQKGAEILVPKLKANIEYIDLSNNRIGQLGAELISEFLAPRKNITQYLNLSGNNIGSKGCIMLMEQVENCQFLRKLDLSRNSITKFAAEDIAGMLKVNKEIHELYLHWNKLFSDGAV